MTKNKPRIVVITGATTTGKSKTSIDAAKKLIKNGVNTKIVSADSVQVYKYMDIGTDKMTIGQQEGIEHHLIDIREPDDTYCAADFAKSASEIIDRAWENNERVIVAGGTGFYVRSLMQSLFEGPARDDELRERLTGEAEENGLGSLYAKLENIDPAAYNRIHPNDSVRIIRALEVYELTGIPISEHYEKQKKTGPRYNALIIGLSNERERMYERINQRVDEMLESGLVEEVMKLREKGFGPGLPSQQSLGYKQIHQMLDKEIDLEEALYLIKRDTRHFSRRQLTWFNKENGLIWVPVEKRDLAIEGSVKFLEDGENIFND
jgi:tRNA dimethylallyltransferase